MDVFFLNIVFAFLLFAVALPLFGVVLGLFCYYVMPYVFGGFAILALVVLAGMKLIVTWWVCLLALVWASAVFYVKILFRKLGEEIEHYHAAHVTLLCGAPYWRRRNALRDTFAAEAEA